MYLCISVKDETNFTKIAKKKMQNKMRDKKVKNSVLAEKFGVSLQTIRNARKGITQSELAEQIRQEVVVLTKSLAVEKKIIMTVPGSIGKMAALSYPAIIVCKNATVSIQ